MKTCVTCKWIECQPNQSVFCGHPDAGIHPVDGKKSFPHTYCADARYGAGNQAYLAFCGMDGRLWEPIEEKPHD